MDDKKDGANSVRSNELLDAIDQYVKNIDEELKNQTNMKEYTKGWWNGRLNGLLNIKRLLNEGI